ncbi:MAG: c-type cytochrome biogenesis protein CcmI [Parvularculaceae bacterium]|nr:c-type cytochrome biogenesis protein CcmI [Parvularculaceae bacterium]
MTVWIFFAAAAGAAALALFLIARPLFDTRALPVDDETAQALRARLAALARDRASGLIDADAAAEAEIEAKRAALGPAPAPASMGNSRPARFGAAVFLGLAPLAAAGLYMLVGAPGLIDPPPAPPQPTPESIAALPEDERRTMIEGMVASLSARLEQEPGDADGWRMLARSQMVLERPADSAASYARLLEVVEGDIDDWRNYATALAAVSPEDQFPATPEFLRVLSEIEKRAPGDMMALFYRGGARREAGDAAGAAALWRQLLAAMPADAPVRSTLEELIAGADAAVLQKSVPK